MIFSALSSSSTLCTLCRAARCTPLHLYALFLILFRFPFIIRLLLPFRDRFDSATECLHTARLKQHFARHKRSRLNYIYLYGVSIFVYYVTFGLAPRSRERTQFRLFSHTFPFFFPFFIITHYISFTHTKTIHAWNTQQVMVCVRSRGFARRNEKTVFTGCIYICMALIWFKYRIYLDIMQLTMINTCARTHHHYVNITVNATRK